MSVCLRILIAFTEKFSFRGVIVSEQTAFFEVLTVKARRHGELDKSGYIDGL
jgi:hypothetical protein